MVDEMDDNGIHEVDEEIRPESRPGAETAGIPWAAALLLVWAVLLIIFSVQNAGVTTVSFLGWSWDMPVALLVMITALITLVLASVVSAFYRRRRRKRRATRRAERFED